MKQHIAPILALALLVANTATASPVTRDRCDKEVRGDSLKWAENIPTVKAEQHLTPPTTFGEDAQVECHLDWRLFTKEPIRQFQVELGTKGGVPYDLYYTDGSGSIPNNQANSLKFSDKRWSIGCKRNEMDDTKFCHASFNALFVTLDDKGHQQILIGGRAFPGSEIAIRFDSNPPIRANERTGFSPQQTHDILEGLAHASTVITRWSEWPYEAAKDDKWSIYNFSTAQDFLQWVMKNLH